MTPNNSYLTLETGLLFIVISLIFNYRGMLTLWVNLERSSNLLRLNINIYAGLNIFIVFIIIRQSWQLLQIIWFYLSVK